MLAEILKEQKKEVQKDLDDGKFGMICSNEDTFKRYTFQIIQSYNAKIIKAVCEEMTGREIFTKLLTTERTLGYNDRILEEQLKAQEILKVINQPIKKICYQTQ